MTETHMTETHMTETHMTETQIPRTQSTDTQPTKTLPLANGLTLTIRDGSRKISADAFVVIMEAGITVPVDGNYLSDQDLDGIPGGMERLRTVVGDTVRFEHRVERNFIMAPEKEFVFNGLVDTLTATLLEYLSSRSFPGKLILKTYRDTVKKRRFS
jgi:hypothetical protein